MKKNRGQRGKHCKTLLMLSLAGMLAFSAPAVTANAKWKDTASGKIYTQKAEPGYKVGLHQIGSYWYYFNANGIMQTGLQKLNDGLRYFNTEGILQKGWIHVTDTGKKYYADEKTGILAVKQWIGDYYFQADASLAVNKWIDGKWVGPTGKYAGVKNNVGWVTDNGKTYYYDRENRLVRGWLNIGTKKYYLHPSTGELMKGWLRIGTDTYYASRAKGLIQKSKWIGGRYLRKTGKMATGMLTVRNKTYLLDSSGYKQTGWQSYNNGYYYFSAGGVMRKSSWLEKKTKYVTKTGKMKTGWCTIKGNTYYFDANGVKKTGWLEADNKKYWLDSASGILRKKAWLHSKQYFANSRGEILTGLHAISSNIYYFDTVTGQKLTHSRKVIGNDTYYFKKNGVAAKNIWVNLKSKYYYFDNAGHMARNTWVGKYYVGPDGARTDQEKTTGWSSDKKFYFDGSGNMVTGFVMIDGNTYYFAPQTGEKMLGLQSIGSSKYYFYPDGTMAVSLSIAVGTKQYDINEKGIVIKETSLKVSGNSTGDKIVNFALKYVGNPYVYGGTSLTNGADCSGFVQTVFANFGYKLLRVADDQMKGPTKSYINNYGYTAAVQVDEGSMLPGDLIFYGSKNYASHVAIYIGNGKIVHASNSQPYPKGGIKITDDYAYQTPIRIVRYWS